MVEEFKTQPFEQRKSQNIGFGDYAKDQLFLGSLPILAGAAAYAVGRFGKQKIAPFNGTAPITVRLYESLFRQGTKRMGGQEIEKLSALDYVPYVKIFNKDPIKQEEAAKSVLNVIKGIEVSAIPIAYLLWKRTEEQQLDVVEVSNQIKDLSDLNPSRESLLSEKHSLQQQLRYEQAKAGIADSNTEPPTTRISESELDGPMVQAQTQRGLS